ncbi:PE family protein [Mycobacterium interjectum]|uniref:PE family protein n=1 Tax=Mycobacterium interjectum TaxID=33895 RepID=UPI0009FC2D45|nr:PE family protein [Mycobacterium interjectum]MCV7088958.1 PE family protein [Mycobacterium interjectum]
MAGIRSSLGGVQRRGPTPVVLPAAAISAMFGNFGQEFQWTGARVHAFHAEFVSLINAGAAGYLSTETANAEQVVANAINAPAEAIPGAAQRVSVSGLQGRILGVGSSGGWLLGGLTGGTSGLGGLLGGLDRRKRSPLGAGVRSRRPGLAGKPGPTGKQPRLAVAGALPGLPTSLGGLTNTLTGRRELAAAGNTQRASRRWPLLHRRRQPRAPTAGPGSRRTRLTAATDLDRPFHLVAHGRLFDTYTESVWNTPLF